MVQICIYQPWPSDEEIKDMIAETRRRTNPGTHIFIVDQPVYNEGHDCFIAGAGGADWTDQKAQEMAADSSINENMTYLGTVFLDNGAGEFSDGCHASGAGESSLGEQAKEYFGG